MKNIYLIESKNEFGDTFYKIGITKRDPKKRLKELQTGNPNKLNLINIFPTSQEYLMESTLHNFFHIERINGEWYEMKKEDIDNFSNICEKVESSLIALKNNSYWQEKKVKRF